MKINKWFWGVFFICAAVAVILNALGYLANVSLFSIIFTVVLIPIIVKSALHRHFAGVFFSLAVIGILFSKPLQIEALSPWPLLGTALFLSIAFSIMFGRKKALGFFLHKHSKKSHDYPDGFEDNAEYIDVNEVECHASFGTCTRYVHCTALRKATLDCSFGAIQIYFDNAQLDPAGATVNVDCSFGSIEMYVPKTWKIESAATAILGAVEEKNKYYEVPDGPLLTIKGSVSLGSLVIVYV